MKDEWLVYEEGRHLPAKHVRQGQRRRIILRAIGAAIFTVVLVFLLILNGEGVRAFWVRLRGEDETPFGSSEQVDGGTVTETETEADSGGLSDTDRGQEAVSDETAAESDEPESGTEYGTTAESDTESLPLVLDLSEAEKGDGYFYNHSGIEWDAEAILSEGFTGAMSYYSEAPVVLILHAATDELYVDASEEKTLHKVYRGVVAVGERLAAELNRRGIPTVHCSVIHEGRDSYREATDTIRSMFEIYPSLKYVIDLHRMEETAEEESGRRSMATRSAIGTAQIRVTVSARGPQAESCFSLALCLRRELNRYGRRLCMPTEVEDRIYFYDPPLCYLKVDVGASGNGSSEALAAAELLGEALADVLKK